MNLIITILGFIILVGGSQLYWLFVGGTSFLLADAVARALDFNWSEWQTITFSIAAGLVGIFLAYYLPKVMVVLAGFFAGGFFTVTLPSIMGWSAPWQEWIAFAVGGLISALILALWYTLALIVVSTLAGAALIVQHISFGRVSQVAMFVVLVVFGLAAQWVLMQYAFHPETE